MTIRFTRSMGTENPMPSARARMAVLIPMSWPLMFSRGPPELPGLMAASVWMKSDWIPPFNRTARWTPLMTPVVTVWPKPNGLPMAITVSPGIRSAETPMFT